MATIGTLIDGKYKILTMIGKGGMSEVYLAMDQNLNKQWAVKEIKKNARDKNNVVVVQSAIAEANMMKKLDHPCLPRIVNIIDREDVIYVVMDYIEGEPLSKVLEREGAQDQEQVIEWAKDLCGVLDYLHSQNPPIIYRDMKPANIMLQPNGNIKLIDFGIAREYKEQNLEDTVSLGTKGYAAPEQFGGKGQTDARTDIYCLGVTLYHLVTGKNPCEPPYEIYPIRYWKPELSSGLESIILKCTQMNPEERYESAVELMYALNHYEEADDSYKRKQWKKVKLFAAMASVSVLFLIGGIATQVLKNQVNNSDYSKLVLQAEKSATDTEQIDFYKQAIEIKPDELEAYLGMIESFKSDASFTVEEEAIFKKCINENLASLREQDGYAELAFEIGKLYWYYYSYGESDTSDNQVTRMKSAIQWFEDARDYGTESDSFHTIADVYSQIGEFNSQYSINIEEASDNGTYAPYFENLSKLVDTVEGENNEMMELEVYRLCSNAIENYSKKFVSDGVEKNQLSELYDQVYAATEKVETSTDKTEEMKQGILDLSAEVKNAIETSDSNTKEGK